MQVGVLENNENGRSPVTYRYDAPPVIQIITGDQSVQVKGYVFQADHTELLQDSMAFLPER